MYFLLPILVLFCSIFATDAGAQSDLQQQPPEPIPTPEFKFVDLSSYVNNPATAPPWTKGYGRLPRNTPVPSLASGVPFRISRAPNGDIALVRGNGNSRTIAFNDRATHIYFFGHVHLNVPRQAIQGKYVIRYADGQSIDIPLDSRRSQPTYNIDDHCCNYIQEATTLAPVAWRDGQQGSKPALFREFPWTNPTPEKTIQEIDFVDQDQNPPVGERWPVLFGITYRPYYVPPPPSCDRYIDLVPYANEPATGFKRDYRRLPTNTVLRSLSSDTPFTVFSRSPDDLPRMVVPNRERWPKIAINGIVGRLHFFGHVFRGDPSEAVQGQYLIHYDDGQSVEIDLDSRQRSRGYNIDEYCCGYPSPDTTGARVAWRDLEVAVNPTVIREFQWTNPRPAVVVKEIEFTDARERPEPMLFAITCLPVIDGPGS